MPKDIYTIANIKKIKWGVLEENQPISLYPIMYPGWCGIISGTGKILGRPQKSATCIHLKDHGIIFIDHKEWTNLGQYALKKILKNPSWGIFLNNKIIEFSDQLVNFTTFKISKTDLKKKTNRQIYQLYQEYLKKHSQLYNYAIIPVYLDLYKPHLTSYLVEYLNHQVSRFNYTKTAKECFALLTVPSKLSKVQEEEISLLRIVSKMFKAGLKGFSRKNLPKVFRKALENHMTKYKYLGYNFEGPAFPDKYFWKRLDDILRDEIKPSLKIKRMMAEKLTAEKIHQKLIKGLEINSLHQKLIEITKGFIYSKDYRKMSLVQSYYETEPLLKEIGRRSKLSLAEVRNCLLGEIKLILEGKLKRTADLSQRMRGCLFVVINKELPGRVFVDNRFTVMKKYLLKREDLTEVNYFHGQTACLGKAEGTVKVINNVREIGKMKPGNIMVSQMTNPDLVPAMKKAAAIVTDLGGITCHAAIVSRELKIPCVIGTKIATKVLKDGDRVEVDASRGDIKKI